MQCKYSAKRGHRGEEVSLLISTVCSSNVPTKFSDRFEEEYRAIIHEDWLIPGNQKSDLRTWDYSMALFNAPLASSDTILDVGCGESHFVVYCGNHVEKAWGIDNASFSNYWDWFETLKEFRVYNQHKVVIIKDDARELPFRDNYLDKIFTFSALEHFDGDADSRFVQEAYRCIKPGGLLVGTVDFNVETEMPMPDHPSCRTYTEESFRRRILDVARFDLIGNACFPTATETGCLVDPLFFGLHKSY
jgi:SAM-dependent methyltransferase